MPKYIVKQGFVKTGDGPDKGPGEELDLDEKDAASLVAQGTLALKSASVSSKATQTAPQGKDR